MSARASIGVRQCVQGQPALTKNTGARGAARFPDYLEGISMEKSHEEGNCSLVSHQLYHQQRKPPFLGDGCNIE